MSSKIESESEDEHFGSFMKVNRVKINLSDNAPSTSAFQLLLEHNQDGGPIVKQLKEDNKNRRGRPVRSNKKQACSQTPTKKSVKKQKLQVEQHYCAEVTKDDDIDVEVPKPNITRKVKCLKIIKRKGPDLLSISDDDSVNSNHTYSLRPKKLIREEVVTITSSPAESISTTEEDGVPLPILETVQEELETDQCDCCKVEKQNCENRLSKSAEQKSLLESLKVLQQSNQNTEKYILEQHRNLLKHPEMDHLCNSIDNSNTNNFLTKGKREWIEKFMDSMLADRIDYVKPNLMNSVQGLQHSSVETDTPVSETDHLSDSVTIVKRIDFEKEKKTRLSQLLERQKSLSMKEPATPSFCTNHIGVTSTPINSESMLPRKTEHSEDNIDLSKLDYSFVTMRTPMKSNANEEQRNSQMVVDNTNREEIRAVAVTDLEDSQLPIDSLPVSNAQNSNINSYIPRHLRPPPEAMCEQAIMNFVDDYLGAETVVINELVDANFDRIRKYNETIRTPNINVINLSDDIYNSAMNDSVILIDDGVNEDDNSVQILDDMASPIIIDDSFSVNIPSTSNKRKRKHEVLVSAKTARRSRVLPIVQESANPVSPEKRGKGKGDCPICLESLDGKEISSTTCGHIFCTRCIKEVIKQTKKCPNCRKGLTLKKIHPLYL